MKLLLAKQDLESYKLEDIEALRVFFKLPETSYDDLLWLIAMKIHKRSGGMSVSDKGRSKISDNFYARNDKTRAYYFTTE